MKYDMVRLSYENKGRRIILAQSLPFPIDSNISCQLDLARTLGHHILERDKLMEK